MKVQNVVKHSTVVTLGYAEHDRICDNSRHYYFAQSLAPQRIPQIVANLKKAGLPLLGCAGDDLLERSKRGGAVDADFYWCGRPYVFVALLTFLSLPDRWEESVWRRAFEIVRENCTDWASSISTINALSILFHGDPGLPPSST